MRVLVVVGHPAHVHFFKNIIDGLRRRNVEVTVAVVEREITCKLLDSLALEYTVVGGLRTGLLGKAMNLPLIDFRLLKLSSEVRPDILVGISGAGIYAAQVAWLLGRKSNFFTDTEQARIINMLGFPFATKIYTPECFYGKIDSRKHVTYSGYHELSYLHPKYFTPDAGVLEYDGLSAGDRFIVVRVSSWDSSHDLSTRGFHGEGELHDFLRGMEAYGRVLVSSEIPLSRAFSGYGIKTPPHLIHHLLAHASAYVGEGATMASEAGVLGVPWIWISRGQRRGYLEEQEKRYGMGSILKTPKEALEKLRVLMADGDTREKWAGKRDKMLGEQIEVTAWVVDGLLNTLGGRKRSETG